VSHEIKGLEYELQNLRNGLEHFRWEFDALGKAVLVTQERYARKMQRINEEVEYAQTALAETTQQLLYVAHLKSNIFDQYYYSSSMQLQRPPLMLDPSCHLLIRIVKKRQKYHRHFLLLH
jgi:cobalamin biosynthesis Co2+ chelatase CbiK